VRIGVRALGRATLARQLLLDRAELDVVDAVHHLAGLQSQTAQTWYVGLWSRLADPAPEAVSTALADRRLIRIALMRGTIHLVTAADAVALRPLVAPVLERSFAGNWGRQLDGGVDLAEVAAAGRAVVDATPATFAELGRRLLARWPDQNPDALAQAVRTAVPLVQVPPRGLWRRSGRAAHTSLEAWLAGVPAADGPATADLPWLVRRYLAAFGPASVADVQTWSGLKRLREVVDGMRGELVTFRDENGVELYDLPDAPRPDPDTPAPPRYLYDFDNLLLSHADRSRVLTDAHRGSWQGRNGPLPGTVLVDGVTAGVWTVARDGGTTALTVRPTGARLDADALHDEGAALLDFLGVEPGGREVRVLPPE
jgi:hypothetical protein